MSRTLRTKLLHESFAHNNKNVGGFFDKGYIKIERKLWDQVYSNELISALNANGMSASLIAGTKPKMTDADWVAMTSFIYGELIKDNGKRKAYKWITTKGLRRNKKEMFCPYVRNSVLNKKLTPSKVDINRGAQNSFRKFTINYFSSGSFKASSGRALRKLGARPGQGATGQVEEHGLKGEDEFLDINLAAMGNRDIGGPRWKGGPPSKDAYRQGQIQTALRKGRRAPGAKGTRVEQRIVKSLVENMGRAAINPNYYDSFHQVVQAKWRDLFGYDHNVDTYETDKGLKRTLTMRSNMVPNVDAYNPGEVDIALAENWRAFLNDPAYFKEEVERLFPNQMTDTFINDLFSNSPKYTSRLTAAASKAIIQNMFPHDSNPDMRLKVNKAIIAAYKASNKKGKIVPNKTKKAKSTKKTRGARMPGKVGLPAIGKVDQKMGQNPMALRNLLNEILPQIVAKNMVSPALQFRTGRFANSVRVDDVTQGPRGGNTMIQASYMTDPYGTFAPGGRKYTPQRNPEKLIARSVREIATSLIGGRFGVQVD